MSTYEVGPAGTEFAETWRTVRGATSVKVTAAALDLRPASATASKGIGTITGAHNDVSELVLNIPGGERTLRSLKFNGFTRPDEDDDERTISIRYQADLDRRIAIALPDPATGERGAPVHTVPRVGRNNEVPPQLGGASFREGVLHLPGLRASKVHITRVQKDRPDEFELQPFSVESVTATISPHPEEIEVAGPDGATLFSLPGAYSRATGPIDVDLRTALQVALDAQLALGEALQATFTLTASVEGQIRSNGISSQGRVTRAFADPVSAATAGRSGTLELPGEALDARRPLRVQADVTVKYDGVALHALSDSVPSEMGALRGRTVGADPVHRPLPPQALRGDTIVRVGVVGRAVGETDLSIAIVEMTGERPGDSLGDPGVVSLTEPATDATAEPAVVWFDLPDPRTIDRPIAFSLTATRGGFRWVGDPLPLVLIGIADPDPAGRLVRIGRTAIAVHDIKETTMAVALDPDDFREGSTADGLPLTGSLFATVRLDKLNLEYAP